MNQQIIDYLQQNKASYAKEVLIQQLRNSGYAENDIREAADFVYGTEISPSSLLSFDTPSFQIRSKTTKTGTNKFMPYIFFAVVLLFIVIIFGTIYKMGMDRDYREGFVDGPFGGYDVGKSPAPDAQSSTVAQNITGYSDQSAKKIPDSTRPNKLSFNGENYFFASYDTEYVTATYTTDGNAFDEQPSSFLIEDYQGRDTKELRNDLVEKIKSQYAGYNVGNDIALKDDGSGIYMAEFGWPGNDNDHPRYSVIKYETKSDGQARSYLYTMTMADQPTKEEFARSRDKLISEMKSFSVE